jgi:demethylmenaquinone methyltransferase/2-methoxy-6-polyprenyl-1,4-benzoquinol methylase
METKKTHFGFQEIPENEKEDRVGEVFRSVASRYDLMNDVMSGGLHRLWKRYAIQLSGVREGSKVLDVAGGTADITKLLLDRVGDSGEVWLTDINANMLTVGRDRLLDSGCMIPACQCNAEALPFASNYFDCVTVAFGLRNMTHKEAAIAEMRRVLRPGGKLLILEFSEVAKPLKPLYDLYSFKILPLMGKLIAKDEESYRYLAESIRMHPNQEALAEMMRDAGFAHVDYFNLAGGVVAVHRGAKIE